MTNRPELTPDLAFAFTLADIADKITLERFGAADLRVDTKPDMTPVTEADKMVERELRTRLSVQFPDDLAVGEEYGGVEDGIPDGRVWIIDPIDGTKNFVRGVPVWSTLIGLAIDGEPHLGVVSAPMLGRRWYAQTGFGAWLDISVNNRPTATKQLHVSNVSDLADASFSFSDPVGWDRFNPNGLRNLVEQTWRTRGYGDYWSHLLVAEGAVDIAAEPELSAWDVAALIPIVREAGGVMTGFDGSAPLSAGSALTTNAALADKARALVS